MLASGSLRETFYPVFRVFSPEQQAYFETIADRLDLSYSMAHTDSDRSTEIRPSEHGNILGRVLYTLGAPLDSTSNQPVLPLYLYYNTTHARKFVEAWCTHYEVR